MNIDEELMEACGYTPESLFKLMQKMNLLTQTSNGIEDMIEKFEDFIPKKALVMLVMSLKKSLDELREAKIKDIHSALETASMAGVEIKELSREEYEQLTEFQKQRVRSIKEEEGENRQKGIPIFMGKPGKA